MTNYSWSQTTLPLCHSRFSNIARAGLGKPRASSSWRLSRQVILPSKSLVQTVILPPPTVKLCSFSNNVIRHARNNTELAEPTWPSLDPWSSMDPWSWCTSQSQSDWSSESDVRRGEQKFISYERKLKLKLHFTGHGRGRG